jgi:hypothetical protein
MYPEAGYSFDGTATTLPRKFGILLKKFDVPVIMIETSELYLRNPLYNELQIRKVANAKARAYVLFTQEDIREKSVKELTDGFETAFGFDHYRWQKEKGLEIQNCLMIGNDRDTDIAGAKALGMGTLYMHTDLTPPEQAKADPALHPDRHQGPHFEYEGDDWSQLVKLVEKIAL